MVSTIFAVSASNEKENGFKVVPAINLLYLQSPQFIVFSEIKVNEGLAVINVPIYRSPYPLILLLFLMALLVPILPIFNPAHIFSKDNLIEFSSF